MKTQNTQLTAEQKRRAIEAREQTIKFLNKEASYAKDLRNVELVEIYEEHLAYLDSLIMGAAA
jgi:hypothetical protein